MTWPVIAGLAVAYVVVMLAVTHAEARTEAMARLAEPQVWEDGQKKLVPQKKGAA